ncbi:MAG: Nif11-like leader peptide family natural product precursor [Xenococcaceae cyanobacterium]
MSVQTALQFIQQLRGDEGLKNRLFALNNSLDLESFVKLGAEVGLAFTAEELLVVEFPRSRSLNRG